MRGLPGPRWSGRCRTRLSSSTTFTWSEISNRLFAFYDWCAHADVPEVTTLAKTIEAWWPQILAFIDTGIAKCPDRGHQPHDQRRRADRLRLPLAPEPAPQSTVALQTDDHSAGARVISPSTSKSL